MFQAQDHISLETHLIPHFCLYNIPNQLSLLVIYTKYVVHDFYIICYVQF